VRAVIGVRLWPQPLLSAGTVVAALLILIAAWLSPLPGFTDGLSLATAVAAICLAAAVVVTYQYPLHLRPRTKIYMASVPYYLLAAVVPPALAATAAGLAALAGELSVSKQRGTKAEGIATEVGRRAVIVLCGSMVAHAAQPGVMHTVALVGAALVMEAGDIVSCPLILAALSGESPLHIVAAVTRDAAVVEGAQYLLGLLGAFAAELYLWAPALLVLPTALVYQALKQAQELHAQAVRARRVAEDAVRVRDEFLIAASHDLRTPLTGVIGYTELMQMHLGDSENPDKEWLLLQIDALSTAGVRMRTTVDEITDVAQLQMGRPLEFHFDPVDLGAVVRSVTTSMPVGARGPGEAPIEVDAPAGMVVRGDSGRLARVVGNIVGNAVKYSLRGTPVQVTVTRDEQWVTMTVRDQGVGIPANELPHVFTHFYRASTALGIPGTGIGLAGAKTIVEQHDGHIAIQSEVGQGTTVRVMLPRVSKTADAPVADQPADPNRQYQAHQIGDQ
jgi:signal transduction histidine kinase